MLMSASSDFIALCQEQVSLLTQGLGASSSVVYLTQELVDHPNEEGLLIPVLVYPEGSRLNYSGDLANLSDSGYVLPDQEQKLLAPKLGSIPSSPHLPDDHTTSLNLEDKYPFGQYQIVLPLVYEGLMVGLLLTAREDRPWTPVEEKEIHCIATTLAIACILDQRQVWLQHQLQQEKALQKEQGDLLDNLLHQFRNPLTAIRTFGKLLLKRLRSNDTNREVAINIINQSDRLQELLQKFDQVLDSKSRDTTAIPILGSALTVEASRQKTAPLLLPGTGEEPTSCYLKNILVPILASAQVLTQEKTIQLLVDIPNHLPPVKANIKALTEVFSNIIDNAIKYTPVGGKISIQSLQKNTDFQGIAISDTGPGIPKEDLERLGERHYRGVQANTDIPGTGLGMAIAKQLIAQMEGEIEVFSPAVEFDRASSSLPGTSFIVWLPQLPHPLNQHPLQGS
ncbi:GAF domain-containing sensor histidine kinase [Cylindrospermopsis raciborskii]|uniref:histidine kinase n=1 Tax=Cylindrospermopsis raciborskii CENA302 TaxID=1170768 RepID=A0A9Q5QWQ5_9CYAN|nr:ATP-binding protein [Cylindrospermopsis raciborskii]NLQ05734.1 GAF domain-containing sensor histidine kinase [Cylindrospermopsis raciborskii MVCC19]OHY36351.1 histidine kinase [Cylindrospermopsis raciborskii MVCC14]OPH09798.1 sensor histidine kinase [Cylindrospermopsis raciborskii CENA302]